MHPCFEDVTADFVYVRLHGADQLYVSGYEEHQIAHWSGRVQAWLEGGEPEDACKACDLPPRPRARGRDVYVFFDNDVKVRAPFDAIALKRALDGHTTREPLPASIEDVREELRTDWAAWRGIGRSRANA